MRVFVTGGTGFIGTPVVKALLRDGHELLVLSLPQGAVPELPGARFVVGDLGNVETYARSLSDFSPEACVHAAWEGIPDFSPGTSRRNVARSLDLVDLLADTISCGKIVGFGSCAEYRRMEGPLKEDDPVASNGYLGWAKAAVDGYGRLRCAEKGIAWIWLRVFYAYGPRQRGGSLIPSILDALAQGRDLPVRNPRNVNDFVYVDDVADCAARALAADPCSGAYNLGRGEPVSVIDVCAAAERLCCGSTPRTDALRARIQAGGPAVGFWADMTKTREAFGWSPGVSLDEGIRRLLEPRETEGTR